MQQSRSNSMYKLVEGLKVGPLNYICFAPQYETNFTLRHFINETKHTAAYRMHVVVNAIECGGYCMVLCR